LTLCRSASFARAVERGDWRRTYQIGHPEVTVMWLVALGLGPERLRPYADDAQRDGERSVAAQPGYMDALVAARGVLAPAHALLVALAALLAWRIWGAAAGVLAGTLLALEPFLVAHGRILRTDALLSELMLIALLAALAFWARRAGAWALALCAVATGLALLTKTPAATLLGAVPLVALLGRRERPLWLLGPWLAGAAAAYVAAWPALWSRPLSTLEKVVEYTGEKGGSPMDAGAYLLGTAAPDPGPLFYGVALLLRMSPVLLVGLLAWATLSIVSSGDDRPGRASEADDARPAASVLAPRLVTRLVARLPRLDDERWQAGTLLVVALLFVAAMMVLPKKSDRYILPAFPLLATVAALGLARLGGRLGGRARRAGRPLARPTEGRPTAPRDWRGDPMARAGHAARRTSGPMPSGPMASWPALLIGAGAVAAVQVAGLLPVWPYPLAYYNPLLGGGATAHAALSVGWGEGLDVAAEALNAAPDAAGLTVATLYPEVLQAQLAGRAVPLDEADVADAVVTYVAATQRRLHPAPLAEALAGLEPARRVAINGIPYAEVYRLPRPAADR
jgi:hypothetical protein